MSPNDTSNQEQALAERQVRDILSAARSQTQFSAPYLETRVMAHLRERKEIARARSFWKSFSMATAGLSLGLMAWIGVTQLRKPNVEPGTQLAALVDKAVVVKVEVQDIQQLAIARAEIELPEGVEFYSKAHPELKAERRILVAWNPGSDKAYFPFAIRALHKGTRPVVVSFYDDSGRMVHQKTVTIRFEGGKTS